MKPTKAKAAPQPAQQDTTSKDGTPAGFMKDARGRLVPQALVRPADLLRDQLVRNLNEQAAALSDKLHDFKALAFSELLALVDLSAEEYGVKLGGAKGNTTFYSFDGALKIQIANADTVAFDERLQAAKEMIDNCISSWSRGADPKIQLLVQRAFETDRKGKLSTGRILELRRANIDDPQWKQAMDAISESVMVVGTRSYIRFYRRVGDTEQYVAVPLDIATV